MTTQRTHRTHRAALVSAYAVPIMVLGQFSMIAIAPLVVLVVATVRQPDLRVIRRPVGLLAALYAIPLAIYLLRPDAAQSLSKDMHPAFIGLIVAAGVFVIARFHLRNRSARRSDVTISSVAA